MDCDSRIYIAGGGTLIGAALIRNLLSKDFENLVGVPPREPDLRSPDEVEDFFCHNRPDHVLFVAGQSGGIGANQSFPAEIMLDNLRSATNVIEAAHRHGVSRLLYLASSCCYPKHCRQPMRVESLETGPLEPTNDAYATAKLAGMKLCQAYARQHSAQFISAIPANAFGIDDDFHPESGHVIPALISRMHEARQSGLPTLTVWGTGIPRREFIFADDLADACLFALDAYYDTQKPINLGGGVDLSIREIAECIQDVVGYKGKLVFDSSKPDGMPRKSLDSSVLFQLGWQPATPIREALDKTYQAFLQSKVNARQEGSHARAVV